MVVVLIGANKEGWVMNADSEIVMRYREKLKNWTTGPGPGEETGL